MNLFAKFAKKYHLSVRELSTICSKRPFPDAPPMNIGRSTIHRLLHNEAMPFTVRRFEPIIVDRCRSYLMSLGKTAAKVRIEVPSQNFLAPLDMSRQFTERITVPSGCNANYVFKDQAGRLLSVQVFNLPSP